MSMLACQFLKTLFSSLDSNNVLKKLDDHLRDFFQKRQLTFEIIANIGIRSEQFLSSFKQALIKSKPIYPNQTLHCLNKN